jgi:hypothetical protein
MAKAGPALFNSRTGFLFIHERMVTLANYKLILFDLDGTMTDV